RPAGPRRARWTPVAAPPRAGRARVGGAPADRAHLVEPQADDPGDRAAHRVSALLHSGGDYNSHGEYGQKFAPGGSCEILRNSSIAGTAVAPCPRARRED